MNQLPPAFWSISATEMLQKLETAKEGLDGKREEAVCRFPCIIPFPRYQRGLRDWPADALVT
jgi:hypothetical protein